jgi:flagellar biosynthesis/type III secretory pathway M-ring protein FliF/YscJ
MGVVIPIAVGVIVSGLLVFAALRARRKPEREPERQPEREQDIPELNKHPERLEQMLDQSDDA